LWPSDCENSPLTKNNPKNIVESGHESHGAILSDERSDEKFREKMTWAALIGIGLSFGFYLLFSSFRNDFWKAFSRKLVQ
jgi:hypothetical protein